MGSPILKWLLDGVGRNKRGGGWHSRNYLINWGGGEGGVGIGKVCEIFVTYLINAVVVAIPKQGVGHCSENLK